VTCEGDGRRKESLPDKGNGPFNEESGQGDSRKKAHFQDIEISKSNLSRNNESTQNKSISQPTSKDLMIEHRLQFQSPDAKRSPPPSRNASPEATKKTHSSLFGAMNSEEFNIVTENAKLKERVLMLEQ
jgi:hypothetical protein